MYSLPIRIRPTPAQSQAGLFIFPCPALPTQHCMAGIQVPPNSTALPTETHISHSSEQPPKPPEEQMSPKGASREDSVGSTHSHPSDKAALPNKNTATKHYNFSQQKHPQSSAHTSLKIKDQHNLEIQYSVCVPSAAGVCPAVTKSASGICRNKFNCQKNSLEENAKLT